MSHAHWLRRLYFLARYKLSFIAPLESNLIVFCWLGLVIRFAQSYHSSCLEKTNQEGEEEKVIEFSDYVNLQVDTKSTGEEQDTFPKYESSRDKAFNK